MMSGAKAGTDSPLTASPNLAGGRRNLNEDAQARQRSITRAFADPLSISLQCLANGLIATAAFHRFDSPSELIAETS